MVNLYALIVGLFTLGGAAVAVWSWKNIRKHRKTASWPSVEATIIEAHKSAKENNLLPLVKFCYQVNSHDYEGIIDIPSGESSMPDFADHFITKYPLNSKVAVLYNPQQPDEHVLAANVNRENWLIFSVGMGAMLLGIIFLATNF